MIDKYIFPISYSACAGLLWLFCSALVAFLPELMTLITGYMFHADFGGLKWTLRWSGFFGWVDNMDGCFRCNRFAIDWNL